MNVLLFILMVKSMIFGVFNYDKNDYVCCYKHLLDEYKLTYNESTFKSGEFYKNGFWPDGIIWYDIDPHMDPALRTLILRAIDYFNNPPMDEYGNPTSTCIQWKQRLADSTNNHWATFIQTYDEKDEPLKSYTGYKVLGVNNIHIYISSHYAEKTRNEVKGTLLSYILQKMMRAMGFIHEVSRRDRDCWLYVSQDLIDGSADFKVYYDDFYYSTGFPFDFESVMMHQIQDTELRPHNKKIKKTGRNDGKISETDWEKINYIYCDGETYCASGRELCEKRYSTYLTNPNCYREGPKYTSSSHTSCVWMPKDDCKMDFDFFN